MDGQLFLRVRGRVLGPYDSEKLRALARRGQLSKMHELSSDGVTWGRASKYPELFVAGPGEAAPDGLSPDDTVKAAQVGGHPPKQAWHYTSNGSEHGPVDFAGLQSLLFNGQVQPDDQVWTDGMAAWTAARAVPGLVRVPAAQAGGSAGSAAVQDMDALSDGLCRSAISSRPWSLFIGVMLFIYAGLLATMAIFLLYLGVKLDMAVSVAQGLFSLIQAGVALVAGCLLTSYSGRLAGLRHSPTGVVLEKALDTLRAFWILVSIVFIVLLALIVFLLVWIIAIGGTLPF